VLNKKEVTRKADDYIRGLVSRNGRGYAVTEKVVNYLQTIGYDEVYQDELILEGLRHRANRMIGKYTRPRDANRDGHAMGATVAEKHDVEMLNVEGISIDRGSIIHKSLALCSIKQLLVVIKRMERSLNPMHKDYVFAVEMYKLRTGKQYKLPFDVPVKIQVEMKAQAEEELRLVS
jgi:hypothetical protein